MADLVFCVENVHAIMVRNLCQYARAPKLWMTKQRG